MYTNPNIKNNFSHLYGSADNSQIEKSIFDEIEKGAKAEIGAVRMWGKEKWVKHPEGWVHVRASGKAILEKPGNVRVDAEKHHIDHFHKHVEIDKKADELLVDELDKLKTAPLRDREIGIKSETSHSWTDDEHNETAKKSGLSRKEYDQLSDAAKMELRSGHKKEKSENLTDKEHSEIAKQNGMTKEEFHNLSDKTKNKLIEEYKNNETDKNRKKDITDYAGEKWAKDNLSNSEKQSLSKLDELMKKEKKDSDKSETPLDKLKDKHKNELKELQDRVKKFDEDFDKKYPLGSRSREQTDNYIKSMKKFDDEHKNLLRKHKREA